MMLSSTKEVDVVSLSMLWLIRVYSWLASDRKSCSVFSFAFEQSMLLVPICLPCCHLSHQHTTTLMGQLGPSRFVVMFLSGRKLGLNHVASDWSYLDFMA